MDTKKIFVQKLLAMNQTNQLQGESQHYEHWFEAKKYLKIRQKDKTVYFNEGKNYNPMKHCKWHNQNENNR